MIPDTLRPWIARIAGVIVSGVLGWLFTRHGIDTPQNVQDILRTVVETVMVMLAGYILTHIPVNKIINPTDAASTGAAAAGVVQQEARKEARAQDDASL